MKTKSIALFVVLLIASACGAGAADNVNEALQKGLLEEEANHNLDAAIQAYQTVVNQFDNQRKIAATAVFRLAECYRKQGKTNEAVAQYQRVLQDFSDQSSLVGPSERMLASFGRGSGAGGSGPAGATAQTVTDPEELGLLKKEIDLAEQEIKTEDASFRNGKGGFADIVRSRKDLLSLKRRLPENASSGAQTNLVGQQLQLVQQLLAEVKKQIEVGARAPGDEIPLQRELLGLQRELIAVSKGSASARVPADAESAAASDEETKEIQRLKAIIRNSPDLINAKDGQVEYTPLHNAASKGQAEVARFLLENRAQVNAKNKYGDTPLHLAASFGHKAIAELLLANGTDVNAADNEGRTALHRAAEKGFLEVAKVLLAKGAEANAKDATDATALHLAVEKGFGAMAKLLIDHKADLNIVRTTQRNLSYAPGDIPLNGTALHIAARGQQELAGLLLKNGAQVDPKDTFGWTPLHVAAKFRQWMIIRELLEKKADVNARGPEGRSALQLCVANKDLYTANLLLQHGADVNNQAEDSTTPLSAAVLSPSLEMVELLLAHKPNLELRGPGGPGGYTPLQWAVAHQQSKLSELLLKAGADPNARMTSELNRTMLHWAVQASNHEPDQHLLEVILTSKVEVNAKDERGRTPLHLAVAAGFIKPVELLLSRGAEVNARTIEGYTALHSAAVNNAKIAELLLKNKAEVNAQDEAGNTPLHYAAISGSKEAVALLLKSKADVNLVNKDGASPLKMVGGGGWSYQYGTELRIPIREVQTLGPRVLRAQSQDIANLLREQGAKE